MMYPLYHQESGTCIFINLCKLSGIEPGRIPVAQNFFIAYFRRMAIFFEMIFISGFFGLVEITGIPIAALSSGLRAKMSIGCFAGIEGKGGSKELSWE